MLFLECTMVFKKINIKNFRKREKKLLLLRMENIISLPVIMLESITFISIQASFFAHKATGKDPINSYRCYSHVLSLILLSYLLP